jgi:hypothetical protein
LVGRVQHRGRDLGRLCAASLTAAQGARMSGPPAPGPYAAGRPEPYSPQQDGILESPQAALASYIPFIRASSKAQGRIVDPTPLPHRGDEGGAHVLGEPRNLVKGGAWRQPFTACVHCVRYSVAVAGRGPASRTPRAHMCMCLACAWLGQARRGATGWGRGSASLTPSLTHATPYGAA